MVPPIDPSQMTPAEIIKELDDSALNWGIYPRAVADDAVLLHVSGEVYPIYRGQRSRRGKRPFNGDRDLNAAVALRLGLVAMRLAERQS